MSALAKLPSVLRRDLRGKKLDAVDARAYVHVYVRGHYSGAYDFTSLAEAQEDAAERRRMMGILGISYIVTERESAPFPWPEPSVDPDAGLG